MNDTARFLLVLAGCIGVAVVAITWRALNRAARYVERCRHRIELGRQLADEQRQMAERSAALDTCNAILRATDARKERP